MDDDLTVLLHRVARSDRDAMREAYIISSSSVYGQLLRILGGESLARSAVKDVYLKIWALREHYTGSHFAAWEWVRLVTLRVALQYLNKGRANDGQAPRYKDLLHLHTAEMARRLKLKSLLFHPHMLIALDAESLGGDDEHRA